MKSETKANKLRSTFGNLAVNVCDEILAVVPTSNIALVNYWLDVRLLLTALKNEKK